MKGTTEMETNTNSTEVQALEVVHAETGRVAQRVDLYGHERRSERFIERMTRGMLRNLDTDRYYVREVSA